MSGEFGETIGLLTMLAILNYVVFLQVLCHTLVSLLPGGEAANVHEDHSVSHM